MQMYNTIKEQEKTNMNLPDFKELIYHLTGWENADDISTFSWVQIPRFGYRTQTWSLLEKKALLRLIQQNRIVCILILSTQA